MRNLPLLIIILLIGFSSNLLAYPISPRPLRQLVEESQFIIVGYVVRTFENVDTSDDWASTVAQIAVMEELQGNIRRDTIEIGFSRGMICPAPDRYFDSTFVISFIDRDENGKFTTHALSYGSKTLKPDEIEVYKKRILEIQKIFKISNETQKLNETVEWLVKCAEVQTTSWEGVFELSPESNFMSYYSQNKTKDYKDFLATSQKERLKKALLNSTEEVDFGLVDLVYRGNEIEIDSFLIEKLSVLKEDDYWLVSDFMERLEHKNASNEIKGIISKCEEMQFEDDKNAEIKKLISRFITLVN